jgi:hypothetical protein
VSDRFGAGFLEKLDETRVELLEPRAVLLRWGSDGVTLVRRRLSLSVAALSTSSRRVVGNSV